MLDAYTVKKFLPRLIIAVILANLSLPLVQVVVQFVNVLGRSIEGILLGSIGAESAAYVAAEASSGSASGLIGLASATALGAAIAGLAVGGIFAIVPAALSILLAIFIVFVVVILRRVLIVLLIVVAPIAIALWAIPGLDKWAGRWWKLLIQLLMVYPIIIALLASGAFVASIVGGVGDESVDLGQSVAILVAILAPYFLIPTVFKLASSTLSNITGVINSRSKGLIDRSKKLRADKFSENWDKTKSGKRFAGGNETNFRGALNRGMQRGSYASKAGLRPSGWRSKINSAIEGRSILDAEKNLKDNPDYFWRGDDDLNRAASESTDETSLRAALRAQDDRRAARGEGRKWGNEGSREFESAVARVEAVRKQMGAPAFRRMTTHQALAGGTAYDDAADAWEAVARAGINDDAATQDLVNRGKSSLMSAGRVDQGGAGFGTTYAAVQLMQDEIRQTGTVSAATRQQVNDMIYTNAWENQGGNALAHSSMKGQAVRNMASYTSGHVDEVLRDTRAAQAAAQAVIADPTSTPQQVQRAQDDSEVAARRAVQEIASLSLTQEGLNASSPEKARVWADGVMSQTVRTSDLPPEIQQSLTTTRQEVSYEPDPANPGAMKQVVTSVQVPPDDSYTYAQLGERLQGNPWFKEMRKTYQNEEQSAQAAAAQQPPGQVNNNVGGGPGSDRRLKRDITPLTRVGDIQLYRFKYNWSEIEYVGVMAQDLLDSYPEAVILGRSGYYTVRYDLLGLKMLRYDEWLERESSRIESVRSA